MGILDATGQAIDKLAFAVSPAWGNKRRAARLTRDLLEHNSKRLQDNNFRQQGRRTSLKRRSFKQAESTPERAHRYASDDYYINSLLEDQLDTLQTQAVGVYGDNSIAHSIIESRVTYEVGPGLKVKPTIRQYLSIVTEEQARDANQAIQRMIKNWSKHGVDKSRTMSYGMAQRLMVREFANYGECFLLLGDVPYSGKGMFGGPVPTAIEFINPMRVATPPWLLNDPTCRMGVQYRNGQVYGYWVKRSNPNDNKEYDTNEYELYPRFDAAGLPRMVHIFETMFAGQARGLPYLTANMNKILDFDDYQEAEIISKQIEACMGLIFKIKKEDPATTYYEMAQAAAAETNEDYELLENINPGFIQRIGSEDDITTVDPNRPGSNYAPFLEGSLRMIAGAANMPYEIVAKNFMRVTYSSGKLAMLDGQMGFNMRRSTLIDAGLTPIHTRLVSDFVFASEADGTIAIEEFVSNPDLYLDHKYQAKQMGEIDDEKRVKSQKLKDELGMATKADFYDEQGEDWEEQQDQRKLEKIRQIDDKLALEKYEMEQRQTMGLPDPMAQDDPEDDPAEEPQDERKLEEANQDD